ncbi:hypothetical protein [Undibacterium sp. Ji49W]|uniref:hypothetical protein n=1 Tax=Undibacterium sp. Ji49W TaxID=3413040 RepID=UPI003BF1E2C7
MFPLKVFRLFEQAAETPQNTTQQRRQTAATTQASGGATSEADESTWPDVDRRQTDGRRRADRREKQHAILLNTRKLQGRRKDPGRRLEDKLAAPNSRIHFSIKG